jgi:peptide/nickel transport system permease protein
MRSLMITNLDEDYVVMAEAKGLSSTRILFRYAMRNSALPQVTMLAITFGQIVSGALLVEIIFDYPGMGWILREAIGHNDYRLIQGIVFVLILSVATATLVFDLVAPLVDRRIVYERS